MRLKITLFLTSLLTLLQFSAYAQQVSRPAKRGGERLEKPAPVIQSRQHHVKKDLIDLCLSTNALAVLGLPGILNPLLAGLNLCLCVHDLDIFLESHVGILLGNLLGGKNSLLARLDLLIHTSPGSHECHYPPHSSPHCIAHNPCGYTCTPPYVPGTLNGHPACICPPPFIECNGQCSRTCGTALPQKRASPRAIKTLSDAYATCKPGQAVCGVPGHVAISSAFECIDTTVASDSCGGCVTPHPFTDSTTSVIGLDCGRLPGVVEASCLESRCLVTQCKDGWTVDSDSRSCIRTPGVGTRMRRARRAATITSKISTLVGPDLSTKIEDLVGLVATLQECSVVPTPSSPLVVPIGSVGLTDGSLVNSIVTVTSNLLISADIDTLIHNVDLLVQSNTLLLGAIDGCGCTDALGLGSLLSSLEAVIGATLDLQAGLGHHVTAHIPGDSPTSTHPSSNPTHQSHTSTSSHHHTPWSTTSTTHSVHHSPHPSATASPVLGAGLSPGLGLGLGTVIGVVADASLNSGLDILNLADVGLLAESDLNFQLDIVVDLVLDLYNQSLAFDIPSSIIPTPQSTSDTGITTNVATSLSATLNTALLLFDSTDYVGLTVNVQSLLDATNLTLAAIDSCGCADTGALQTIATSLDALVAATLNLKSWCTKHYRLRSRSPLPDLTATQIVSRDQDDGIVVGLDHLFSLLNLKAVKARIGFKGLAGPGLSHTVNGYLDDLHIGLANSHAHKRADGVPVRSKHNTKATVNATLVANIKTLTYLVVDLGHACGSSSLPHVPYNPPTEVIPGSSSIDTGLFTAIISKTELLLNVNTIGSLVVAVDALVDISSAVKTTVGGCGCVDDLGLGVVVVGLEAVVAAALDLQVWLSLNPVIIGVGSHSPQHPSHVPHVPHYTHHPHTTTGIVALPPSPSAIPGPGPVGREPNPALGLPIDLGLNATLCGLLTALHLDLGVVVGDDAIAQLGTIVDGVVGLVLGITGHIGAGVALPPLPSASFTPSASAGASATILPIPNHPSGAPPPYPIHPGLLDQLVGLTGQLVSATNISALSVGAAALLDLNNILSTSLLGCGCINALGLGGIVKDAEALTAQLVGILGWCADNQDTISLGSGVEPIIVNASHLLTSLGLGDALHLDGIVDGLGGGVSQPTNSILHLLGLGGLRLRKWLGRE